MQVKRILISQKTPLNEAPFTSLEETYGVKVEFKPFFTIQPLSSMEFRMQRVSLGDFTAIVFSSRHAIDAFFKLCEELRVAVPQTMKYFCTTEAVAMYLQKHIIFRKRKIFYGDGSPASVLELIKGKHSGEKFLVTQTADTDGSALTALMDAQKLDYTAAALIKSVPEDLKGLDLKGFDLIIFYNPADVKSLYENFPGFQQEGLRIAAYGKSIVKAMEEAGLEIEFKAPTPQAPSVAKALELYLKKLA